MLGKDTKWIAGKGNEIKYFGVKIISLFHGKHFHQQTIILIDSCLRNAFGFIFIYSLYLQFFSNRLVLF